MRWPLSEEEAEAESLKRDLWSSAFLERLRQHTGACPVTVEMAISDAEKATDAYVKRFFTK